MACFLVPTAEAIVVSMITKISEHKDTSNKVEVSSDKIPFTRKLKWLSGMLWGGSALLAFEHVWHGEVTPWFPFLTAMGNEADAAEMFHEMATAGVLMAVLVTVVWGGMCIAADLITKRAAKKAVSGGDNA
ncbi:hypothetical protein SAMN02910456_02435 [Ruminococcaceae bacterium YRB3002]|nr:hypothetical protein SAMN02910456_02435 [Ruminococcaceae bacterium YRB3002]